MYKQFWMLHFGQIFSFLNKNKRYVFIGYSNGGFKYKCLDNKNTYTLNFKDKSKFTTVHGIKKITYDRLK